MLPIQSTLKKHHYNELQWQMAMHDNILSAFMAKMAWSKYIIQVQQIFYMKLLFRQQPLLLRAAIKVL